MLHKLLNWILFKIFEASAKQTENKTEMLLLETELNLKDYVYKKRMIIWKYSLMFYITLFLRK